MTSPPQPAHVPVMLDRVLELLAPALQAEGAVAVDATLGLGGHSAALLERLPGVRLVAVDRDPDALRRAADRLAPYGERVTFAHATYDRIPDVLAEHGIDRVDGVLFDLGVSSMQLDQRERGFSYAADAPLDMRMDPTTGPSAEDVVNTYSVAELTRVLRTYGEERFAHRIALAIERERAKAPITRTGVLAELVRSAIPAAARRTGGHPAKRTFQALRVEVNAELSVLERALPAAIDALRVGGRLVVLAYQSLEDRIVKRTFAAYTSVDLPPDLPVLPQTAAPALRLLTKGAELASDAERAANPRSAPVRLRAVERVREAA